ncbi:hypothetical protein ABVT39_008556 [Epinephelus coioides]
MEDDVSGGSEENDVSGGFEEEDGEHLPELEEVIPAPETLPPEEDVEFGGPVETSPNSATETPVAVTNSGGGDDVDVVELVQSIRL